MKNTKKLFALLLAAVMVLAMSAAAFAEDDGGGETGSGTSSYSYEIYQIFTGDYSDGILSNVKWGSNGTGTIGGAVDDDTLAALEDISGSTSDSEKLKTVLKYADLTGTPYAFAAGTGTTVTISDIPVGYYLIKDEDGSLAGEDDSYTLYIVLAVDGEITITRKANVPESEKKVKDINDSTDASTSGWQDSADWDIGDSIPFQLKAILPNNVSEYETYTLIFHDVESAGLTFDSASVKVCVDGGEIGSSYYTVETNTEDGCTFEVIIEDVKSAGATDNSVVTVEYSSTLNEGAVIGSGGNPNTMHIEYSNNPNSSGEGADTETGETPDDTVIVFTYQVTVNKVTENPDYDEDEEDSEQYIPLEGAGFTLYKWIPDESGESEEGGSWVAVGSEITGDGLTTFTWKGIDDGTYKLVETTTPRGYNTMDDIEFTVTAAHDTESDSPGLTSLDGGELSSGSVDTGTVSADVVNESGATLPSTGGMGTTLLYVIGAILVLGAGTLLIVRRRMNGKE